MSTSNFNKQDILEIVANLETLAINLYGKQNVAKIKTDEYWAYTINISPRDVKRTGYMPSEIELYFDEREVYMTIDDYRWEFDGNFDKARDTAISYLKGIHKGSVTEKKLKILGITLSSKLVD